MITSHTTNSGRPEWREDGYILKADWGVGKVTVLLHENSCILTSYEIKERKCAICGPIKIPDDLWTLYVLLDGRGAHD